MSVYFEKKISTTFGDICTEISWYKDQKLAIASFSQEQGGYINVYKPAEEVLESPNLRNQKPVVTMAWHPGGSLFGAWDGGSFSFWSEETNETFSIESPHQATIVLLKFSRKGGRLISADAEGGLVGWNSGGKQLLTAFHHQLTDPVSHIVYRNPSKKGLIDLRGAARAAVAGDPRALDLFTNLDTFTSWRPKTGCRDNAFYSDQSDNQSFYAASSSGVLFYISENGHCQEVFTLQCACCDILYRSDKDQLIVLTELMAVIQFIISPEGALEELMKVKLSGGSRDSISGMVWTKPGTVAVSTGSSSIRLWNLDTGDNSTLNLPVGSHHTEVFTSVSYCSTKDMRGTEVANVGPPGQAIESPLARAVESKPLLLFPIIVGVLCGGTNAGNLLMWKKGEEEWELENSFPTSAPVKQVIWGNELLVINTLASLYILKQQPLAAHHNQKVTAVQTTGNSIVLSVENPTQDLIKANIKCEMQIHGVTVSSKYCVLWSDKNVASYSFALEQDGTISSQVAGTFACKCEDAAVFEENLTVMERERVTVRTIQGTVKQTLFLIATEGTPIVLDLFSHFVTVVTSEGCLKVWDISRREAKLHTRGKNLNDLIENYGEVIKASCNSNGSKLALIVALDTMIPDSKLYVMDCESNNVQWVDFSSGESRAGAREEINFFQNVSGKVISSFKWDIDDPKLLVCHVKPMPFKSKEDVSGKESFAVLLWASGEKGLLIHEMIPLNPRHAKLLSCSAPEILFLSSRKADVLEKVVLGDFNGVECKSPATKQAILNFSYNLAVGNMDLAFKAINAISSESVWTNLAKNCVKTKRLDVATVCMGRVKNGRIAKALREALKEPELEARIAILAIHVGMLEEAEELLKSCKRYDLLNKFYQATSDWEKAIKVAEKYDRVHLRNTYHLYAKYLEQNGRIDESLEHYEKADTHRIYAPRLLLDDPAKLKAYVDRSGDLALSKWIAQYMESQGDMDTALHYYTVAKDHLSVVRVLCFLNNFHQASELVESSGDRAAAYHLARKLEAMDRIEEALVLFTRAQTYGNAIRLCKENGYVDKIWSVALPACPRDQAEAARYLEEQGEVDKAILLYHKAGLVHKALDLAFSSGSTTALASMASDLTPDTDPVLLQKVADFFISNYQYDRAVDVLANGGKFSEAVALCVEHSVPLTDELVSRLNPTGPDRNKLLIEIGECALAQNNYYLATKKFTQAGDKVRAMKALLKSGDTEKIIFLAGVSREKEVYVMAANYLQALDWRSDPQLLNTIIQFYTKAKAHLALSNFYVACANVEVEEYQDYEKAVVALSEAKRCLHKSSGDPSSRKALEAIDNKIGSLNQYLEARRAFENGFHEDGMTQCRQMLSHIDDGGSVVRPGDVYALMLDHEKDPARARELFEAMKRKVNDPTRYLSVSVLEAVGFKELSPGPQFDDDLGFEVK